MTIYSETSLENISAAKRSDETNTHNATVRVHIQSDIIDAWCFWDLK